jgi:ketosteroid isomerase-like protein
MDQTILSLEKVAMNRLGHGDPWGFVELSAEDIIYVDPALARPIYGLEPFKDYMGQLEGKIRYQGSEYIDPRIVTAVDAAVISYNYRSLASDPVRKTKIQTPWNVTCVYFRREARWRIVHTHWSYVHQKHPTILEIPVPVYSAHQEYKGVLGEILALESAAMERWRKGDPWGFIELSAPEVTYFDTGTPQRINGLEALRAEYAQREGKIFYDVMDFIEPRVQVYSDMAVLVYRFLSTRLEPDGSVAYRTPWNCTEVFVRAGGSWKIIHTHWSYIQGERG